MNDSNEHIDALIIRSLQRRTTRAEEAQLRAWREAGWANEEKYRSMAELWSVVSAASLAEREAKIPPDAAFIIARAEADAAEARRTRSTPAAIPAGGTQRKRRRRGMWGRRLAIGALAASLTAVGFGVGLFSSDVLLRPAESLAYQEVITGEDESTTVTFSDNTAVRLGPSSKLRLVDDGDNPVVSLEGRAYFGVVPNPSRTFTVRTAYGDAVALGTRFEVRTEAEELRVLVVQGNVRVLAPDSSVDLGEGFMSRNGQGAPLSMSRVEDVEAQLAWIGRVLMFRATPLSRVAREIAQRYDVTVAVVDDSLRDLTVTATFTDEPVESVVYIVCEIVGARCSAQDGRFRIGDGSAGALRSSTRSAGPARSP